MKSVLSENPETQIFSSDAASTAGNACASSDAPEALVRVVEVTPERIWLEPMQGGSCGGCASSAVCGEKGIGTLASRLEARRFSVAGQFPFKVGDRLVIAFNQRNLVRAAAIAYVLPLVFALVCAVFAQQQFNNDAKTLVAMVVGLFTGFIAMKFLAGRMEVRGALQARIVRRDDETPIRFHSSGASHDA
jgi:sigma-E factor negative regulatory protein RseC